ncbi:hypothetical protein HFP72_00355 [Nocardiopsis sp. ARC36]
MVAELHGRYRIHAGQETLTDLSLYRSVPPQPRTAPDTVAAPCPTGTRGPGRGRRRPAGGGAGGGRWEPW